MKTIQFICALAFTLTVSESAFAQQKSNQAAGYSPAEEEKVVIYQFVNNAGDALEWKPLVKNDRWKIKASELKAHPLQSFGVSIIDGSGQNITITQMMMTFMPQIGDAQLATIKGFDEKLSAAFDKAKPGDSIILSDFIASANGKEVTIAPLVIDIIN